MECVVYVYVGMYSVCVYGIIYGMCRFLGGGLILGVGANICVSWGAVTVVCVYDMYVFVCRVVCVYDMCMSGMSDMVFRYVCMGA